jgi:hypothetical protein
MEKYGNVHVRHRWLAKTTAVPGADADPNPRQTGIHDCTVIMYVFHGTSDEAPFGNRKYAGAAGTQQNTNRPSFLLQ